MVITKSNFTLWALDKVSVAAFIIVPNVGSESWFNEGVAKLICNKLGNSSNRKTKFIKHMLQRQVVVGDKIMIWYHGQILLLMESSGDAPLLGCFRLGMELFIGRFIKNGRGDNFLVHKTYE